MRRTDSEMMEWGRGEKGSIEQPSGAVACKGAASPLPAGLGSSDEICLWDCSTTDMQCVVQLGPTALDAGGRCGELGRAARTGPVQGPSDGANACVKGGEMHLEMLGARAAVCCRATALPVPGRRGRLCEYGRIRTLTRLRGVCRGRRRAATVASSGRRRRTRCATMS